MTVQGETMLLLISDAMVSDPHHHIGAIHKILFVVGVLVVVTLVVIRILIWRGGDHGRPTHGAQGRQRTRRGRRR